MQTSMDKRIVCHLPPSSASPAIHHAHRITHHPLRQLHHPPFAALPAFRHITRYPPSPLHHPLLSAINAFLTLRMQCTEEAQSRR
jgi:hypothetical protein